MKKDPKFTQKKAVALYYDQQKDYAPIVTAKGKGLIAENIIQTAKDNGVPIQEDEALVQLLSEIELHDKIPESLYEVVAEILSFVYILNEEAKKE
ncbi:MULTISPECIES: EscU/YscU/HrcU family type III secretion system export apparatus switch protein [Bacillus]|uniref:EscU/YscU/HrcU family type III secretion system export apparatus switch protein n=1 Tax=Bacillus TaxID=1386 RepID=UPI003872E525